MLWGLGMKVGPGQEGGYLGLFSAWWGLTGIMLLLGSAVYRLGQVALTGVQEGLSFGQWMALGLSLVVMGVFEGYQGFQRRFSPRVVARAHYLLGHARVGWAILAPLFCMGYFHATRRRKLGSWGLTLGIVGLVWMVRHLSQPWRGIVDAGVVLGLCWGMMSILWFVWRRWWRGEDGEVDPEVPCGDGESGSGSGSVQK